MHEPTGVLAAARTVLAAARAMLTDNSRQGSRSEATLTSTPQPDLMLTPTINASISTATQRPSHPDAGCNGQTTADRQRQQRESE